MKNQYIGEDCLKRGLGQFAHLRGGGEVGKKEGVVFLRGVDTPMHTMVITTFYIFPFLYFRSTLQNRDMKKAII